MECLIDGNNLLYAAHAYGPGGAPIGREWLCELLGRWARRTATSVVMVFDGPAPHEGLQGQMRATGIDVRFSAPRSADEVIEDHIAEAVRPGDLRIVTSDHAIQHAARARRCACVDSEVFAEELFAREASPPPHPPPQIPEKPAPPSQPETDAWLRGFEYNPDEPPDETDVMRY